MTVVYLYCIECLLLVKKRLAISKLFTSDCGLRKIMRGSKVPPNHDILASQHLSLWKK